MPVNILQWITLFGFLISSFAFFFQGCSVALRCHATPINHARYYAQEMYLLVIAVATFPSSIVFAGIVDTLIKI